MAQVIRFFHVRHNNSPRGGATVRVVGEDDGKAVRVQVSYCSPNDQFCRKTGRENAAKSSTTTAIPLKGLPGMLHKISMKVLRKTAYNFDFIGEPKAFIGWRQRTELYRRDWSFATKYWTPKGVGHGGGSGGAPAVVFRDAGEVLNEQLTVH
jgi:hypothetical protein